MIAPRPNQLIIDKPPNEFGRRDPAKPWQWVCNTADAQGYPSHCSDGDTSTWPIALVAARCHAEARHGVRI